ncbi:hypothetical protein [Vibrio sp. 03_296]|uniref:hypothetical protein n=1 Tax=Vibrio sp. 03_296 TaxID=2024409 RepID=UPI002D8022BA|nr:hypothetical protein [Vibrio sp. 03_296]
MLGDTRKLVITPERFAYFATDDRAAGGITTTEMAIDGQTIDLSCNMQNGVATRGLLWYFDFY